MSLYMTTIKPWRVLESKVVYKTKWIEVVEDRCLANDLEVTYTYVKEKSSGNAMIIAQDDNGLFWMVKQYRHPIKKIIWQFAVETGVVGEKWMEMAHRGLLEELGFKAKTMIDLGEFYPDPGGLEQRYRLFLAQDLTKASDLEIIAHDDEVEELEIARFSRQEIEQMIESGDICDNWSFSALYLYDRYKKIHSF